MGLQIRDLPQGRSQWQFIPRSRDHQKEEEDDSTTNQNSSTTTTSAASSSSSRPPSAWGEVHKSSIAPQDLFRLGPYHGQFSCYDEKGIPTHDKDGQEISKALRKKLEKKYQKHVKLQGGGGFRSDQRSK